MDLRSFALEIHENAKAHGWWDEKRSDAEIIALIHSEWSEALEEYRAGRPMVYCVNPDCKILRGGKACMESCARVCGFRGRTAKPEGIAVELIDGCIRILDYLATCLDRFPESCQEGREGLTTAEKAFNCVSVSCPRAFAEMSLPQLVTTLHYFTTFSANMDTYKTKISDVSGLCYCITQVGWWIRANGIDPDEIMLAKHEYNKTRPFRHGGKVI